MLDPKLKNFISSKLTEDCIIVFDESIGIDEECIDYLSMHINKATLEDAS